MYITEMKRKRKIAAVIVAAGKGARFGGEVPKQYALLGGKPVLRHTLDAFDRHSAIDTIYLVADPEHAPYYKECLEGLETSVIVTEGGATRQVSVYRGLQVLEEKAPEAVLIHDAARCCVSQEVIDRVVEALDDHDAAIPVLPLTDTVKRVAGDKVQETLDRSALALAQTPQGFDYALITRLHAEYDGQAMTDDAALVEASGGMLATVAGSRENIKITTMQDVAEAERILGCERRVQVGQGYDVHAFADTEGELKICGVSVPHTQTLEGHSDADVGLHALVDALLGAIGAGDIGEHFPPGDPQWKGKDSAHFVRHAVSLVTKQGGEVQHVDITIVAEAPKLASYKATMKAKVALLLGIPETRVNIKATTTEKLGFTGRGEGMAAYAIATVRV